MDPLKVIIIAGPNGAGKTTFARAFLPHEAGCNVFINADMIAAGISPFAPERVALKAGRIMLELIQDNVKRLESFAFETTLASLNYMRHISQWQALGYQVELFFLSLPSADMAITRVAERVRQGGHHIPEAVIRRRFDSGLKNFELFYKPLVDAWSFYDNSSEKPILLKRSHSL
jgi:predicted ABC-type ATPase